MTMDRRQFLFAALWSGAARARKTPRVPLLDRGFAQVTKIAEGVYATIADFTKGQQAASNGGVIAGRDAVLIVEGHFQPAGAALEVEFARSVSKAPIRAALDTHYHLDHTFGNSYYADQRIPIIGHERVTPLMKERYAALKGADKTPLLAPFEQKLAKAADAAEKQHKESDLQAMKWMLGAIDTTTLAFPTESLAPADVPKRIDLGRLTAVVEFHAGHTPTDLIVLVPERDVVFTGDLLFNQQYPVTIDADMLAWRNVLDRFAGYGRRTQFVPGHGAVCGMENVRDQSDFLDDLRGHAEKMIRAGATAEEAERRYHAPQRYEPYHIFSWGFTVGAAMENYFAQLAPTRRAAPPPRPAPAA